MCNCYRGTAQAFIAAAAAFLSIEAINWRAGIQLKNYSAQARSINFGDAHPHSVWVRCNGFHHATLERCGRSPRNSHVTFLQCRRGMPPVRRRSMNLTPCLDCFFVSRSTTRHPAAKHCNWPFTGLLATLIPTAPLRRTTPRLLRLLDELGNGGGIVSTTREQTTPIH